MQCKSCGRDIPADSAFCTYCGSNTGIDGDSGSVSKNTPDRSPEKKHPHSIWRSLAIMIGIILLVVTPILAKVLIDYRTTKPREDYFSLADQVTSKKTEAAQLCQTNEKIKASRLYEKAIDTETDLDIAHRKAFGTGLPSFTRAEFEELIF